MMNSRYRIPITVALAARSLEEKRLVSLSTRVRHVRFQTSVSSFQIIQRTTNSSTKRQFVSFSLIFSKSLSCIKTLKSNRKLRFDSSMNPNIVSMVIDSSRQSFLFYSQNIVQGKCLNTFVPLKTEHFSYIDKKLLL